MIAPSLSQSRITTTFAGLREQHRIAMMPFVAAGYPDLATTASTLVALESAGANLIEVGFRFR